MLAVAIAGGGVSERMQVQTVFRRLLNNGLLNTVCQVKHSAHDGNTNNGQHADDNENYF